MSAKRLTRLRRTVRRVMTVAGIPVVVELRPDGTLAARNKRFRRCWVVRLEDLFPALLQQRGLARLEQLPMFERPVEPRIEEGT